MGRNTFRASLGHSAHYRTHAPAVFKGTKVREIETCTLGAGKKIHAKKTEVPSEISSS